MSRLKGFASHGNRYSPQFYTYKDLAAKKRKLKEALVTHPPYGDAVNKSLERQHSLYCISTHHTQCTSIHCMLELLIEVYF